MALQSSGLITLQDIEDEFGGTGAISLSEYYSAASGVPASGTISLSDFYGKSNVIVLTSAGTVNGQAQRQQITTSSFISSGGSLQIPSNLWVWSDSTGTAALIIDTPNATIINYGRIIGKGGAGGYGHQNGFAGGPAISVTASGVTIQNQSGAFIAGGGGGGAGRDLGSGTRTGGGGGAGGGKGGGSSGGAGGALGAAGSNGTGSGGGGVGGAGGNQGGSSGSASGDDRFGTGGGGGRVLTGAGQGNAAAAYSAAGGGWGAAGAANAANSRSGGAGGAAISGTGRTLSNSGTIYGST